MKEVTIMSQINWQDSIDRGLEQARPEGSLLLVDFNAAPK